MTHKREIANTLMNIFTFKIIGNSEINNNLKMNTNYI